MIDIDLDVPLVLTVFILGFWAGCLAMQESRKMIYREAEKVKTWLNEIKRRQGEL